MIFKILFSNLAVSLVVFMSTLSLNADVLPYRRGDLVTTNLRICYRQLVAQLPRHDSVNRVPGVWSHVPNHAQNDLPKFGLSPGNIDDPTGHNLCGPVCLVKIANRLAPNNAVPDLMQLNFIVRQIGTELNLDVSRIIHQGMETFELAAMLKAYLELLKVKVSVDVYGVEESRFTDSEAGKAARRSIDFGQLTTFNSSKYERFFIVNYDIFRDISPANIVIGNTDAGWAGGHFVILTDIKPIAGRNGAFSYNLIDPRGAFEPLPADAPMGTHRRQISFNNGEMRPIDLSGPLGIRTYELGWLNGNTRSDGLINRRLYRGFREHADGTRNPYSSWITQPLHSLITSVIVVDVLK